MVLHQSNQRGQRRGGDGHQIGVLRLSYSWTEPDRAAAKRAVQFLSELAKSEDRVGDIVEQGAVEVFF